MPGELLLISSNNLRDMNDFLINQSSIVLGGTSTVFADQEKPIQNLFKMIFFNGFRIVSIMKTLLKPLQHLEQKLEIPKNRRVLRDPGTKVLIP